MPAIFSLRPPINHIKLKANVGLCRDARGELKASFYLLQLLLMHMRLSRATSLRKCRVSPPGRTPAPAKMCAGATRANRPAGARAETATVGLGAQRELLTSREVRGRRKRRVPRARPPTARSRSRRACRDVAMDSFLVLLHSLSARLASEELTQLKFLCQDRVGKRKLERMQSGLDLFTVLLEQSALSHEHTELLRHLLASLRREDLLQLLDAFEASAAGGAAPEQRELHAAFDIVCSHVGRDWRQLARRLQLSDPRIDAIEERFPRNLPEQVREMLRVWRKATKEAATVAQLVAALRACQMNLVADLVEAGTTQTQGL